MITLVLPTPSKMKKRGETNENRYEYGYIKL